jgi:hypothetical protein
MKENELKKKGFCFLNNFFLILDFAFWSRLLGRDGIWSRLLGRDGFY